MMTKGTSPRNLLVRNPTRKRPHESVETNSSNVGTMTLSRIGTMTPTRKVLTPISENVSDPLTYDELGYEATTPKRKTDAPTPKKRTVGNNLFPDTENVADLQAGTADVTSSKLAGLTPGRCKNILAGLLKKSPAVARSNQEICHSDSNTEENLTPRRRLAYNAEVVQTGTSIKTSTKANSEHLTPKGFRSAGRKGTSETEVGTSSRCGSGQLVNGTPSSSRTARSLKYGASAGTVSTGLGVSHIRASGSVLNRQLSMSNLQASQQVVEQHFDLVEDPHFWEDHNVQVLIRTRPIYNAEMASPGFTRCLRQESPHTIAWLGQPESRFTFDHVAGDIVTQEKLFQVAGLPMVENCMSGYNSCMFAYGQTGSGKTHTMLGDIDNIDRRPSEDRGMTPRVFEYLFERIRKEEELRKDENLMFMCRCSFLEIYNEQITDLLEPSSTNLHMREDSRTGVYVENLSEVEVQNVQDVIQLLIQGASNRRVAATNMNRESSRSHSVFTCIVESKWERDSMTNIRFGRLNLVDLAGSERQKSSGAEGERLKEAASINKSLSTLGLVIMILVDVANGKQRHVPYRDSKLTFLLQDSLGGNSKTIIIATVSPASCNAMETLSTLKFAQRVKLIRNTAVINEDASGDVKALRLQLQLMKEELDRIRRQSISSIPSALLPVDRSWDATRALGSPTGTNKQLKAMESIVAGALRREKAAEDVAKRLASEIELLQRLVQQREEESQGGKMVLRFRDDKIRRLEALSQGLLEVDSHLAEEKNILSEEIKLLKSQMDCNPELTRFAMENIRLLDELKSLKEFQEGKQEVMAQEICNLRDKLLEVLEGKIANDQVRSSLSSSQGHILTSEIAAKDREIERLRTEAGDHRSELDHDRSNLNSVLESNAALVRQVDDLHALVEQLRGDTGVQNDLEKEVSHRILETQQVDHLQHIMELKTRLVQMESRAEIEARKSQHLELQLQKSLQEAHDLRNQLLELTPNTEDLERRIRMEMEEAAIEQKQRLADYEAMAVLWNQKESELRAQLEEVQCAMDTILEKQVTEPEELLISQEEIRHLQMELVSAEASRNEELALRERLEKNNNDMIGEHSQQLEEIFSKLAEEREIVEALESQQVLSINEIEKLQESNEKMLMRLKRREEKERLLKKKINRLMWELTKEQELRDVEREVEEGGMLDEEEMMALELKLENARKELDVARELNAKFQGEQDLQKITQQDLDYSRSEAETETALVITSMQDELMALEDELIDLTHRETAAQEQVNHLREDLTAAHGILDDLRNENALLRRDHEAMKNEKDAEIRSLQKSWETASGKLIDYLADGDQALLEAVQEMEELVELSIPSRRVQQTSKNKAHQFLREQLQLAQDVARETESKVRELARRALEVTAETDDHSTEISLFDEVNVRRLLWDSLKFEKASIELTAEKKFTDKRIAECETMLLAMQDDLAHAEMKLFRAEERNLELAKAQEALAVTNQEWDMEKATLTRTLRAVEEQYADVQQALSTLQTQMNSAKCREEALIEELEELRLVKEKCDIQKRDLENELVDMRAALEKHNYETMKQDMSDVKELRICQNKPEITEVQALLTEIESLNLANQNLELERNKAGEEAVHLVRLIKEKEIALRNTNDALVQLNLELQEAVEAQDPHQRHSMTWVAERGELLTECTSLEKILDVATSNTHQAEEKANSLEFLVQEFSQEQEKWKCEISNLSLQVEEMKSRLADKETECKVVKDESERLQAALLSVQKEEASATCDLIALKQKIRRSEAHGRDEAENAERSSEKDNEIFRRQREVEVYEDEITKLMTMVAQTEERLAKLESDWRREKETLLAERDIARLDANQRGSEAATLARNFESNRATLREAEMMVDALVQAKDSARSEAEGWKLENERVCRGQEVAINNVYEETQEVLAITKVEVGKTIKHCEKEMQVLAEDLQKLKEELMDGLHIPIASLREDFEIDFKACQDKFAEALEKAQTSISSLTEKLRSAEETQQNHDAEVAELQSALMHAHGALHQSQAEVYALKCMLRDGHDSKSCDHEASQEGLDIAQVAVSKLQASVAGKDADLLALHVKLGECHGQTADIERNHQNTMTELQAELAIKVHELDLMKEELAALNVAASNAAEENVMMRDQIEELRTKAAALEAELEVKVSAVKALELELLYAEKKRDSMLQEAEINMKEVESQRDSLRADLLALKMELELAQRADKDAELDDCKARISNLMLAAEGQATEYHQKLKDLASMVEQVKAEDRRLSSAIPTTPKTGEKSKSPLKGPGSPFSCMGKGMSQQRTAELGAELSAQERRIEELENLAASRQREIFILNTRLAEAESQTHDVIRELLGVKLDISNYTETQQEVQRLAEGARRRSMTPEKPGKNLVQEAEIEDLRVQLNELIEERESWLEDLNRRHAEIVAARISADKMRQRDQVLSAENEKLKLENAGCSQRIVELEKDIKKLSGQQNLQQRIHHHAKIKEENTTLRRKTEDISAKLRRTEILFARVNDELAKYRTAEGKTPFLNIDEEQCLRSKLQEAEDAKIQMAQKLITLYSSIVKAADSTPSAKEVDHSSALLALEKIKERMQSTEQELADIKFKSKMAGEKRRLSDLRAAHSPYKSSNISEPQNLFCPSPTPR